jgi:hypothetical protein
MIELPASTLTILGGHIAAANNVSFLRRKLSESPTVQDLSARCTSTDLEASLLHLLRAERPLDEAEQTLGYCLGTALLLKNPSQAALLSQAPEVDSLYWLRDLLALATTPMNTTRLDARQGPLRSPQTSFSSSASTVILLPSGEPQQ